MVLANYNRTMQIATRRGKLSSRDEHKNATCFEKLRAVSQYSQRIRGRESRGITTMTPLNQSDTRCCSRRSITDVTSKLRHVRCFLNCAVAPVK
ncbi:hypothetical protein PUN28_011055 [Cardiocondyla obscurior]|uniref:Uncharacterized protein n=1 Tax=Cardiocondyla obscurior TaxID=286306 RepID=A0AAW2FMB0_9HYME